MMNYPPFYLLVRCFEVAPLAFKTYINLWRVQESFMFSISNEYVKEELGLHPDKFKEQLLQLKRARLLDYSCTALDYNICLNKEPAKAQGFKMC